MALQADQLMRGLQLDDASMQKLELDMREEVRVCFCVSFVRRGGAFLFEFVCLTSGAFRLNWKCL